MKSIPFDEVTNKIAEHQEQFNTVHSQWNPKEQSVNICFELDDDEIVEINRTKKIWYKQIVGSGKMRPMRLSPFKNQMIMDPNGRKLEDLDDIDLTTPEGKALFASIAIMSTENMKDATPWKIIQRVNEMIKKINFNKA